MKNILTAPFIQEISEMTANMYRLGWDERNGGNISWLLEDGPLEYYLDLDHVIRTIPINFDASYVAGRIFMVTGTGKEGKCSRTYMAVIFTADRYGWIFR